MKLFLLLCLLVIFASAMVLAQSNRLTAINQAPLLEGALPSGLARANPASQGKIAESYGRLPLSFEANQGQSDGRVKFLSRGTSYRLFLTNDEAVFTLRGGETKTDKSVGELRPKATAPNDTAVLRMTLLHANRAAKVTGADELPGRSNYFIGNDPKKWRSNIPTYAKVKYEGIYSGIDLVYYGNQGQLEYDFIVAPGADPNCISFNVRGAKKIYRDANGDLVLHIAKGEVRWHRPVVYQERDGMRQEVGARYTITHTNQVRFGLAKYDVSRPLYIDPLIYSTYLGGSEGDSGTSIAVDSSGNAYVTGDTSSTNFPTTLGAFQTVCNGGSGCSSEGDVFVSKIDASGSALVYSTYLGGSGNDDGYGIAVDSVGNAYVTGYTTSTDFPTMNPLQSANGGGYDAFVATLNPSGSALVYSTYLGGKGSDYGYAIAVDSVGNAYVTGLTISTNFPTMNPLQPTNAGYGDAFVTEISPFGSALVYSTYLGGSKGRDIGQGIALDSSGNAYITGVTYSAAFPTTPGAFQTVCNGGSFCIDYGDAFVSKINSSGSALAYSTYLGGSKSDSGYGIAVDSVGDAYVTGVTSSTNFPTMNPFQRAAAGDGDAFVTEINPSGSALVYSTYLGGSAGDSGYGIAVDGSGSTYITGYTFSTDFPTANPLQSYGGGGDAFLAKLNPAGSSLFYSTYLGGSGEDLGRGIAIDSSENAYLTGFTASTNFPTVNPLQRRFGGGSSDAFVVGVPTAAVVTLSPPSLNFGNQTIGIPSVPLVSTLTNTGADNLIVSSTSVTGADVGDFGVKSTCPTLLAPNDSCTITVTFTPSATGTRTAALTITDNATGSPQSLPFSGMGVLPAVVFSPSSLTFPNQVVFTTSKPKTITLMNSGLGVLNITSIAATGSFSQTNTCGTTVKAGASCKISVTFSPTTIGPLTGSITVTDNAPNSPQQVTLAGTGTYVQLTPATVNFGNQPVGTQSLPKTITLSNKGSVTVNITGISLTGADVSDFAETNNCGSSVLAGASCFIKVTFTPSVVGTRTAMVEVSDDGGGSPQSVPLTGTGTP